MKRRDFIAHSTSVLLSTGLVKCSTGMEGKKADDMQRQTLKGGSADKQSDSRSPRRSQSGPTDIKSLSTILQRARCPLSEPQVNYLLKLKTGEEFSQKMMEVLDNKQQEAVKNASGGRGGGRRRR